MVQKYPIGAGIQLSLDGTTWYSLTDHNREPIAFENEIIEKAERMANGSMRKYVISNKAKISTSWEYVPSKSDLTVDKNKSHDWISSFYNKNLVLPLYLRIIKSTTPDPLSLGSVPNESAGTTSLTGYEQFTVYITNFSSNIIHRTKDTDFVSMDIEFMEV